MNKRIPPSLNLPRLQLEQILGGGFTLDQVKRLLTEEIMCFRCYIDKAITGLKLSLGVLLTSINYIMFPEQAYKSAAVALGIAVLMDIVSKYVAISVNNGGFRNAFREGKIFSKSLWQGTKVKLITYLSISIMVGASYRLNTLPNSLSSVSKFMATVVYTVLFLREFQSMLENFRDAGADVDWLLLFTRRKEEEILKKEGIENKEESEVEEDYDERI